MQRRSSSTATRSNGNKQPSSSIWTGAAYTSSSKEKKGEDTKKRRLSAIEVVICMIGSAVLFIGFVNLALFLKQQGNLPTALRVSINFGKDTDEAQLQYTLMDNVKVQESDKERQLLDGKVGSHFLPPPESLRTSQETAPQTKSPNVSRYREGDIVPVKIITDEELLAIEKEQIEMVRRESAEIKYAKEKRTTRKRELAQDYLPQPITEKAKIQAKEREKGNARSILYFMELSKSRGHDKERLLQLIQKNARLDYISETTYESLPRWSQVTDMIGTQPKLIGLEQCQAFQRNGDIADKILAVAGCFNSGTNLLAKTLVRNCVMHKRQEKYGTKQLGIRWQVPYGKHTPPKDEEFRNSHVAQKSENVTAAQTLPAVMIRDPFRWLQSMCSHHYTTRWPRVFRQDHPYYHCPNLWPTEPEKHRLKLLQREPLIEDQDVLVTESEADSPRDTPEAGEIKANDTSPADESQDDDKSSVEEQNLQQQSRDRSQLTLEELKRHYFPVRVKYSNFTRHHRSLVHFYNEWYQEYLDLQDYPHLIIRMEDLLFFPDEVVPQICECAGGKLKVTRKAHVHIVAESAKLKHSTKFMEEGQEHTGYLDALIRYGTSKTRFKGMTPQDLQYASHYLNRTIMDLFQYGYPL